MRVHKNIQVITCKNTITNYHHVCIQYTIVAQELRVFMNIYGTPLPGRSSVARLSQPNDLIPLCKYLQFTDCEKNQFLKQ